MNTFLVGIKTRNTRNTGSMTLHTYYRGCSQRMENGTKKIQNHTMRISNYYNYSINMTSIHSEVLADLLNKTKPHCIKNRTMRIRTMRGPPVLSKQ